MICAVLISLIDIAFPVVSKFTIDSIIPGRDFKKFTVLKKTSRLDNKVKKLTESNTVTANKNPINTDQRKLFLNCLKAFFNISISFISYSILFMIALLLREIFQVGIRIAITAKTIKNKGRYTCFQVTRE